MSVPPETMRRPSAARASASARALATTCWAYWENAGCPASRNATALAAMTCMSGPPCNMGKTALSTAFANS